ncbi:AraC family transcriptional regulator [Streptococcus varani]|uniref:AraC family transcriptional regulator n=1 Tax=Streptococcus varani TaxID=1608583 RepID=A0A0E4CS62_9STRE|nr:helix-turn-helix domain-containing protein [Streptococcus varani]CQR24168.1 AraC family transcriptional regulator [Streptococcus varani]
MLEWDYTVLISLTLILAGQDVADIMKWLDIYRLVENGMNFLDAWSHIDINTIRKNETLQFFDNKIRIIYSLLGSVNIQRNDESTTLGNDDFFILSNATRYELSQMKGKVYYFALDYFRGNMSEVEYIFQGDSVNKVKGSDFEVSQSLKQLLLFKATGSTLSNSRLYEEYFSLISILESYYSAEIKFKNKKNGRIKIEDLKIYIDNYFDRDLTLTNLAQKMFVSEQYLSKLFKEEVGIGISEYIIRKRLEKVRSFLTETELSITDIAFSAGFSNINSFNRLFKKYQGLTPSDYRSETKKNVVISSKPNQQVEDDFSDVKEFIENDLKESKSSIIQISTANASPYHHDKLMINLGAAEDLLHRSYIKTVKPISQYAEFRYGRVWGLISQSILTEHDGFFDFAKVDEVLQAILDLGLKPFIELGIKGKVIHGANRKIIKQSLLSLPNQSMENLLNRYSILVEHCIEKFGYDEVTNWIFEVWKPNKMVLGAVDQLSLGQFDYKGKTIDITSNEGYLSFFTFIYQRIKGILPGVKIGGCGLSVGIEGRETDDLLASWAKNGVGPDFLSLYVFPMDIVKERTLHNSDFYISPDSDYLIRTVKNVKDYLKQIDWERPIFITEFNVTISGRDIINDTSFKGAYILKNTLPIIDQVDLLGYWQLSDFSSTAIDVANDEIFGGSGIITKSGIPKPAFYAFDFLSSLGSEVLYLSDGLIVTRDKQKIQVLAYHYCHLNSQYYYVDEKVFDKNNIGDMFEQDGISKFEIILTELTSDKPYQMRKRKMGVGNGAILGEANLFSSTSNYRSDEVDYLIHRCLPTLSRDSFKAGPEGLRVRFELQPHDMIFIEISQ